MSQVTITLNGRTYRLACGAGDEPRLLELADMVREKLHGLVAQFGQAGDDRLLLMAALLIADELVDARAQLASIAPSSIASASTASAAVAAVDPSTVSSGPPQTWASSLEQQVAEPPPSGLHRLDGEVHRPDHVPPALPAHTRGTRPPARRQQG